MRGNGIVFDIQRGSFVDGPGIRTTVFFKGCNLRCKWCHNPEGWFTQKQLMLFRNRCVKCGMCQTVCSVHDPWNRTDCILCGKCAEVCPQNAREICGYEIDEENLLQIIRKDIPFYQSTDGGVTFSGGECMLQIGFLYKILDRCKEEQINTAVDTAGNVPFPVFERILPLTDIFLYDLKCVDSNKHKLYTGCDNKQILDNLQRLSDSGARIWIRIPLIGSVNDNESEMSAFGKILRTINYERIDLLDYHNLGVSKYFSIFDNKGTIFTKVSADRKKMLENILYRNISRP